MSTKQVEQMQSNFRILKDWDIKYDNTSEYKGQTSIHPRKQIATIYAWDDESKTPDDFFFHEILHICCREMQRGDWYEKEEILIQDICGITHLNNYEK